MADSRKIEMDLTAEGEGFKKAVIIDPDGHVAGRMEAFIDLGDKKRYDYKVSAEIPPRHRSGLWSVPLQDVAATRIAGLKPFFATSQRSFFRVPPPRDK